jgi:hypothetical protein
MDAGGNLCVYPALDSKLVIESILVGCAEGQ